LTKIFSRVAGLQPNQTFGGHLGQLIIFYPFFSKIIQTLAKPRPSIWHSS
jgi:hypothetical protein